MDLLYGYDPCLWLGTFSDLFLNSAMDEKIGEEQTTEVSRSRSADSIGQPAIPETFEIETVQPLDPNQSPNTRLFKKWEKILDCTASISAVSTCAFLGVAGRMALIELFSFVHPDMFLYSVAWANFAGSFIMGITSEHKSALSARISSLGPAITSGFCGSLTSFSTVIVAGVKISFGIPTCQMSSYERLFTFLENYFFNFFVSYCCLLYGRQLAHLGVIERLFSPCLDREKPKRRFEIKSNIFLIGIHIFMSVILILLCVVVPDTRHYALAILFSQFGAVIRFYLGKHLNSRCPSFPLGTYCANMSGTVISAVLVSVTVYLSTTFSYSPFIPVLLSSLVNGFCGAMTTVSSFVSELSQLSTPKSTIRYAFVTLFCAQLLAFLPFICFQCLGDNAKSLYC